MARRNLGVLFCFIIERLATRAPADVWTFGCSLHELCSWPLPLGVGLDGCLLLAHRNSEQGLERALPLNQVMLCV